MYKHIEGLSKRLARQGFSVGEKQLEKYKPLLNELQEEHFQLLDAAFQPMPKKELLEGVLRVSNQTKNFKSYIKPLLEKGLLQRTIPDKPTSTLQQYFATERGKILLYLYKEGQEDKSLAPYL